MEHKLDLILQKLETLDELKEIVVALRDRQEETDAKLEALTIDAHKLHGEFTRLEEKSDKNHKETMDELKNLKLDMEFTYQKTSLNETSAT